MATPEQPVRATFDLEPRGPALSPRTIGTLAQGEGVLAGAIVDGSVRTWLTDTNGQLTLVMWPGNFRARFDPLEVIDDHGEVVARGGEVATVAGGFLRTGDPRSLGHDRVFSAWQVSQRTAGAVTTASRSPPEPFAPSRQASSEAAAVRWATEGKAAHRAGDCRSSKAAMRGGWRAAGSSSCQASGLAPYPQDGQSRSLCAGSNRCDPAAFRR